MPLQRERLRVQQVSNKLKKEIRAGASETPPGVRLSGDTGGVFLFNFTTQKVEHKNTPLPRGLGVH